MHLILGGMDVSKYVKDGGIRRGETQRSVKSRVTLEGKRYVSQIRKLTYRITFDPMSEGDLQTLATIIAGDYIQVSYKDPVLGYICKSFIPEVGNISLVLEDKNGVSYWSGLVLDLEEQ